MECLVLERCETHPVRKRNDHGIKTDRALNFTSYNLALNYYDRFSHENLLKNR